MNKVHTKHYWTDRRHSSYQTLLLSLYSTQTLQEKSWKEDFLGRAKISSGYEGVEWHWYLPKQTTVSDLSTGREHFQFLLPTFPAATAHKTLVAKTPSQPRVFTEWGGQAENLLFPPWFSVWFSCFIPPEEEEGRASACPIACVNHSAHQNSSWVAPYPGDPGSRIVPELWMLEKHSNNSDTDSCCYSNLKVFFNFFCFLFFIFHLIPHFRPWSWKRAAPPMCCAWLNTYS